jgi:broad specificity phosphatase PhoE
MTEQDEAWSPHTRETRNDVIRRVHSFFNWVSHQPHKCIAVVSHGVWMECALMEFCPDVLDGGNKRVYNCDVYRGTLSRGRGDNTVVLKDVGQVSLYNA